ncbi:MAG TPA: GGDEF domain-containing protein [Candidatus Ozemobacteraceae bacterium]|nr:GGDEF domain-containing protein [Candidatus Ozemobacteraceae bacterium]
MKEHLLPSLCQTLAGLPSDRRACRTIQRIMRCMEASLGASAAALVCKNKRTDDLEVSACHNIFREAARQYVRQVGTGAIGRLFYSEPLLILTRESPKEDYEELKIETDYRFAIASRVSSSSGVYGFLIVYFEKEPEDSPLVTQLVQAAAGLCGAAREREELLDALDELRRFDPETGLLCYAYFMDKLGEEIAKSHRYHLPLSLIVMDVDNFKPVIKSCGMHAGIELLQELAEALKFCIRGVDVLGRFGSDEYIMYFPSTELSKAEAVMNRFRDELRSRTFTKHSIKTSLCYGLTAYRQDDSAGSMLERATFALYEARRAGTDQLAIKI